jgi:hypothetical protein
MNYEVVMGLGTITYVHTTFRKNLVRNSQVNGREVGDSQTHRMEIA